MECATRHRRAGMTLQPSCSAVLQPWTVPYGPLRGAGMGCEKDGGPEMKEFLGMFCVWTCSRFEILASFVPHA